METLRALFAIYGLTVHLLDAMKAYVGSEIDRQLLMKPPQGFEHKDGEVCEILQSLYGLKQSGRLWNLKIAGLKILELLLRWYNRSFILAED